MRRHLFWLLVAVVAGIVAHTERCIAVFEEVLCGAA